MSVTLSAPAVAEPPPRSASTELAATSSESMTMRSSTGPRLAARPRRTASTRIAAFRVLAAGNWASALYEAPHPVSRCCT